MKLSKRVRESQSSTMGHPLFCNVGKVWLAYVTLHLLSWCQLGSTSICRHYGNFCGLFHPLLLRKCHPTLQALKNCQWRMSRPELGLDYPNCLHRLVLLSVNHVSFIGLFEPSFPAGCVSFYYSTFFSWTCLLQYFESFFLYWVLRKCQWHCSFIIVPFRWFHNGLFLYFLAVICCLSWWWFIWILTFCEQFPLTIAIFSF